MATKTLLTELTGLDLTKSSGSILDLNAVLSTAGAFSAGWFLIPLIVKSAMEKKDENGNSEE